MNHAQLPAIGLVAPSGSGKTSLLRKLVPLLRQRGLRIGYLKHAHHGFALDRPGKDSYEVAAAGARQVMLVSGEHWALLSRSNERAEDHPAGFDSLCARFDADSLDLLLIEGFRAAAVPKIEVFRAATGKTPLYPDDDGIIAVVSDDPLPVSPHPPILPLRDPAALADFIVGLVREQVRVHMRDQTPGALGIVWHDKMRDQTRDQRRGQARDRVALHDDPRLSVLQALQRLRVNGYPEAAIGRASVRQGERFWLTPSSVACDQLSIDDLIPCALDEPVPGDDSMEAALHRELYQRQPEIGALLQTLGAYSVAIGLAAAPTFEPPDDQAARLLGAVPVLRLELEPDAQLQQTSVTLAATLAAALAAHPACLIAGHGVYARGADPDQACRWSLMLEHSARIAAIARQAPLR